MMKFQNRTEKRQVTETMNGLIIPLLYYLDEETKRRIKRGLEILNNMEIEEEEDRWGKRE